MKSWTYGKSGLCDIEDETEKKGLGVRRDRNAGEMEGNWRRDRDGGKLGA